MRSSLRRVFTNLLENALRYARGADGTARVDVSAEVQAQKVVVTLRDHGAGVPAEQLPRLTQPFFRGDAARTAASGSGPGTGHRQQGSGAHGRSVAAAQPPEGGLVAELTFCCAVESGARQQRDRARLDAAALADRPHLLGRLGLDVDLGDIDSQPARCARIAAFVGREL